MEKLYVYNKKTKQVEEEKIYGESWIKFLYGRSLIGKVLLSLVAQSPLSSYLYGLWQRTPFTKSKIAPFIKKFHVNEKEFLHSEFHSFNDFFIRQLKPKVRPINYDSNVVISPCDGRLHVIPSLDKETSFMLKGGQYNLKSLLKDPTLEEKYKDGLMVIARLCPCDYHRFHFPFDAEIIEHKKIPGTLFSVNPLAVQKHNSALWENKRECTLLRTKEFKDVLMVEIGATNVGAIHQTFGNATHVKKGEEKGCFSFGGSCLLLLFEKGTIRFDQELIDYSKQGIEVKMQLGDCIATKVL